MQHKMFRLTDEDIEELRDHTRDESLIAAWRNWVPRVGQLDALIQQIETAFGGVKLRDGIGLLEADAIDDYASNEEREQVRLRDERDDWRRIDTDMLNRCYVAPVYFDAQGFVFHLPAFLIAELNDEFGYGFLDRLICPDRQQGWVQLLTPAQRRAIAATLRLISEHPEYHHRAVEIERAVNENFNDSEPE